MNDIKAIIETIVPTEIQQDEGVKARSYVLDPVTLQEVLKGDGKPQEVAQSYQLDVFFKAKGELLNKASALVTALGGYSLSAFSFRWESSARLWRGTVTIIKL